MAPATRCRECCAGTRSGRLPTGRRRRSGRGAPAVLRPAPRRCRNTRRRDEPCRSRTRRARPEPLARPRVKGGIQRDPRARIAAPHRSNDPREVGCRRKIAGISARVASEQQACTMQRISILSRGKMRRSPIDNHHPVINRIAKPCLQFIYTMKGLGKVHPPDHVVLKDIWLSFLPGAKIGVLGLNGSGKSTLLRIMAGEDQQFVGEAWPAEGISVGFLPQEPRLDPAKTVLGNVEEGRRRDQGAAHALRRDQREVRRGAVARRDGQGPRGAGQGPGPDRGGQRLGPRLAASSWRWTRCGCRRPTRTSRRCRAASAAASRCAGCCCKSPDLLLLDEPTNHLDAESVAWLERFLKDYPGTVVAVTHDRYFLDNVAGWILELDRGSGIPWEGNYSSWLEQKQKRLRDRGEAGDRSGSARSQRELEWIRMSPRARQAKGKARLNAYEDLLKEETAQKIEQVEIYIPPGPRLGDIVVEARGLRKGYGDVLLMDDVELHAAARRDRRRDRPERRRQDDAVPDDHRDRSSPTAARCGSARRCRSATSTSRATRSSPDKTVWEEITGGRDDVELGKRDGRVARLRVVVQLQGARSAAQGRRALGRRAQPRPPGEAAEGRREPAAPRRADQRPRRRHAARARRGAALVCRLRRRHQPRPLVPRSHRDAHAGVRRATARSCGSRGTTRTTRPIGSAGSAPRPTSRTGSSTAS